MATKKRWRGRAAYAELLEQREREGLTFSELSARSGVPIGTLQRWGRQLRREATASAESFVEILPTPTAEQEDRVEVLLCSGRRLYLPAARPFTGLSELVTLLETC